MLKSVFVVAYLLVLFSLTFRSIGGVAAGENMIAWIGILLTCGPMAFFLMRVTLLKDIARTSANLTTILILALVGSAMNLQQVLFAGAEVWFLFAAFGMTFLFFIYDFWYSRLDRSYSKLKVGQKPSSFSVLDLDGAEVTNDMLCGQPVVLVFYRGNWCPLCMAQIKEISSQYNAMKEKGVRVAFVSPQPQNHTEALAKKFAVGIEFYRDNRNQAAQTLGIVSKSGTPAGLQALGYDSDTVLPTVLILDKEGRVVWLDETDNYRVRPEPATFLKVLAEKGLISV